MFHMGILRVFLTCFSASQAGVGAGLANQVRERAHSRDNGRRRRAVGRAVLARLQCNQVVLLARCKHLGTVYRTGIADALTFIACDRALLEVCGMLVFFLSLGTAGSRSQANYQK
jgi:hypothetical protein